MLLEEAKIRRQGWQLLETSVGQEMLREAMVGLTRKRTMSTTHDLEKG